MNLAALVAYTTDIRSIGIQMAAGTRLSETYYWDLNERTRAFQKRIAPKVTLWPNMAQAGDYSCTLHYLKTVADHGRGGGEGGRRGDGRPHEGDADRRRLLRAGQDPRGRPQADAGLSVRGEAAGREQGASGTSTS